MASTAVKQVWTGDVFDTPGVQKLLSKKHLTTKSNLEACSFAVRSHGAYIQADIQDM
jgi:hypothetical protein